MDIANFTTYREVDDEDPDQVKRKKQREKKAVNKFSLLYMFPGSLLNEKGTGNKRKGFVTYDSLVCKKCSPVRFFHARSALKLHAIEAHDRTESRGFANYSIPAVSRITHTRKAKQKRVQNIECVDLSDSENDDESEDEIEILQENDDQQDVSITTMEGLSISNKNSSEKSSPNESGYGSDNSDIECVEETLPNKELQNVLQDISKNIESRNTATSDPEEVTLEEEELDDPISEAVVLVQNNSQKIRNAATSKPDEVTLEEEEMGAPISEAVEVVLDDEVNAENGHIRNLMKEFQSPIRKRKEKFANSISKKARVNEGDDILLAEIPATQEDDDESDAPKILIGDSFSLQESCVNMDEEDDDIFII